ncbi:MAG: cyclopropane-fatty-acyl-phospholipid synthase [Pelagibacterium sp. SCN 64-44]|nr:MAG: cyclopropane-fatty-acyl-phospholipid synthase [Pelagibacterium sp. SCN 64-44]
MDSLILNVIKHVVKSGTLTITTADGKSTTFGDGTGTPVAVRFCSASAQRQILFDPDLRLGEAYVDGEMVLEEGSVTDLLDLVLSQYQSAQHSVSTKILSAFRFAFRHLSQYNRRGRSKRNVAHHYDLNGRLYDLFLDSDRQYSCAYFERENDTLDAAQLAKKRHLAAKLLVNRGARVLDIGCGWGGLARYISRQYGAEVTGITLSEEQLAYARSSKTALSATADVDFRLIDYRDVEGPFDRIVSVGMFEHVGARHYDEFFGKCRELLTEDGVFLLHSIGRFDPPDFTNPWIAKYIFPGGYIPALSEVLAAIERSGLVVTDIEILRLHYAETLKHWRERFLAARTAAADLYDERFVRMWEFYLAGSEMAFRHQGMMVFQIQVAKRQGAVPLTRDYIGREEERLRVAEVVGQRESVLPIA